MIKRGAAALLLAAAVLQCLFAVVQVPNDEWEEGKQGQIIMKPENGMARQVVISSSAWMCMSAWMGSLLLVLRECNYTGFYRPSICIIAEITVGLT